jgi:hypothetical protein
MPEEREQRRHSRRTIAKGAAWAVPAVPLAVATPAYAASGVCVPDITFSDRSCKCPGLGQNDNNYFVRVCFADSATCAAPEAGDTFWVTIRSNTGSRPIELSEQITVAVDGCSNRILTFTGDNAANFLLVSIGGSQAEAEAALPRRVPAPPNCVPGDLGTCPRDL